MSELNIYQRINKVMHDVAYVKRESAGQGDGVKYDEVAAKVRASMIKHGIVATISQTKEARKIREESTFEAKNNRGETYLKKEPRIYSAMFAVSLVNIDNPKDTHIYSVESHAMDMGDKAPGELNTYAMKVALVKAFLLESGINEESREETRERLTGNNLASAQEYAQMMELINKSRTELPADRFENALNYFKQTGIDVDAIESGAVSKNNASSISRALTKALSSNAKA